MPPSWHRWIVTILSDNIPTAIIKGVNRNCSATVSVVSSKRCGVLYRDSHITITSTDLAVNRSISWYPSSCASTVPTNHILVVLGIRRCNRANEKDQTANDRFHIPMPWFVSSATSKFLSDYLWDRDCESNHFLSEFYDIFSVGRHKVRYRFFITYFIACRNNG